AAAAKQSTRTDAPPSQLHSAITIPPKSCRRGARSNAPPPTTILGGNPSPTGDDRGAAARGQRGATTAAEDRVVSWLLGSADGPRRAEPLMASGDETIASVDVASATPATSDERLRRMAQVAADLSAKPLDH